MTRMNRRHAHSSAACRGLLLALAACLVLAAPSSVSAEGTRKPRDRERPARELTLEKFTNVDRLFQRLDRNGDGAVTAADAPEDGKAARWDRRLADLDLDENGTVTREELRESRRRRFQERDENGDGVLTGDELPERGDRDRARAREGQAGGGGPERRLDADGDGAVSFEEFSRGERGFQRLDRDGDGVVLRADLLDAPGAERLLKAFDRLDGDQDGRVTQTEARDSRRALFDRLDADGDGMLSPDEAAKMRARGRRGRGAGGGHGPS